MWRGQSVPVPWTVSKNDNRWRWWHGSLGVSVMCHGVVANLWWLFAIDVSDFLWFYDCKFSWSNDFQMLIDSVVGVRSLTLRSPRSPRSPEVSHHALSVFVPQLKDDGSHDRHRPHRRNTCCHGSTTCTTAAGETCPKGPSMVPCLWWFLEISGVFRW